MLIVGGSLAFAIAQSQPPPPRPAKSTQENKSQSGPKQAESTSNQQPPIDIPALADKVSAELARRNQQETNSNGKQKPSVDWWGIIRDALLVVFSGALAWLAHRQHQAMIGQKSAMEKQGTFMEKALAETEKAANAAASSAKTAQRSLHISQQPLVLVESMVLSDVPVVHPSVMLPGTLRQSSIHIHLKNTGATLAKDFYYAFWYCGDGVKQLIVSSTRTVLQPNVIVPESQMLGDIGDKVFSGKVRVVGFIRYRGLFDELPGTYVEIEAIFDRAVRDFRIKTEIKEDGGYPEPC